MTRPRSRAPRIGVVGGGLAGTAAALRCADAGADVTLVEARARLGGVAGSFRRGALDVDTGQHVFLRCCNAYRAFLGRIGAADRVVLQDRLDIPLRAPDLPHWRLRRSRLPAPLHLAGALLRHRALGVGQRIALVPAARALAAVDVTDPAVDAQSFGDWLAAHGQSAAAIEALWDLVGIATLNARAADASLALAATVFQQGLLTEAAAGDIGWATAPLGALHGDAALAALQAAGVLVRTATRAVGLRPDGSGWRIGCADRDGERELAVDQVVCAVPHPAAERLLPGGTLDLAPDWAARLGSSPIVNVHVVYDRQVLDEQFAAGVGTPVQWVFDRTSSSGAATAYPAGAQYLAVSLSAADDLIALRAAEVLDTIRPALAALFPAARTARVLDAFVTREPHATFRAAPGTAALRPSARTRLPGLALAGAWTDTGWPATMEGAVRSGDAAAAVVLAAAPPAEVMAA